MVSAHVQSSKKPPVLLWAGLFGAPLFVASLLYFGSLNPDYRHATRAVSRLGGLGAPGFVGFDIFGLLIPGLIIAGVGVELRRAELGVGASSRSSIGLVVFGFTQALTAVPADFQRMFHSPWTWIHAFFVTAPIALLFAVLPGCYRSMRRLGATRVNGGVFLLLGFLPVAEFLLYTLFPGKPGLVQRLMILTIHVTIAWLSYFLLGVRERSSTQPSGMAGTHSRARSINSSHD